MDAKIKQVLDTFEARMGVEFNDRTLLLQALTHRSFLNENRSHPTGHNERLEFLGDAVVEIIVTETLYRKYPDLPEGELTNYRSALVCADTMASAWESLGLWETMLLSKGEARGSTENTKSRKYICANAFEACIGALYLDKGMGECRMMLDHLLHRRMKEIIASGTDFKGKLQEDAQARFKLTPSYRTIEESGPDHDKHFRVGCYIGSVLIAEAEGSSRKEAEITAA
ncbi:MAG: ribonuclease III, partial [Patescibacteria group bacterium]